MEQGDDPDKFPDELLLLIFHNVWSPVHCWNAAQVCKRWCTLLMLQLLRRRSNPVPGRYPCSCSKKGAQFRCDGTIRVLRLPNVESEWRLGMNFIKSCRRHTHVLEMKDCSHISELGFQLIAGFASNLKTLQLGSCVKMDDPSFDGLLSACNSLYSLHIYNASKLSLKNVDKLAPKLGKLCVHGCPNVTPTIVLNILNGCPNLRSLSLSAMGVSPDSDKIKLAEGRPFRLQTLELLNTRGVTDPFVQALAGRLSNLRNLNLSKCPLLSDDGLTVMIASCGRSLQRLVVTYCRSVSDHSARALAAVAANLQDMSLAGTNVSDDGLETLMGSAAVLSKLRNLSVAGCGRVTNGGLQQLVSKQTHRKVFKTLDVQRCPNVSPPGLEALRSPTKRKAWKIVS